MIKPSIGYGVLFHPQEGHAPAQTGAVPALVCFVHHDRCVNVGGFDQNGYPISGQSITLLQDDDPVPTSGPYAEWPKEQTS